MPVQKMKLVSEFSRILTVIAEHGGTWNVERDEGHFRDVHMDVSVLAEHPQLRLRMLGVSICDIYSTSVITKGSIWQVSSWSSGMETILWLS